MSRLGEEKLAARLAKARAELNKIHKTGSIQEVRMARKRVKRVSRQLRLRKRPVRGAAAAASGAE